MKVGSEEETSQALETIRFRDISEKYNDSNSFVMLALLATKEDSKEIEEGLKNFGFLGQKSKITKMFDIVGDKKFTGMMFWLLWKRLNLMDWLDLGLMILSGLTISSTIIGLTI